MYRSKILIPYSVSYFDRKLGTCCPINNGDSRPSCCVNLISEIVYGLASKFCAVCSSTSNSVKSPDNWVCSLSHQREDCNGSPQAEIVSDRKWNLPPLYDGYTIYFTKVKLHVATANLYFYRKIGWLHGNEIL